MPIHAKPSKLSVANETSPADEAAINRFIEGAPDGGGKRNAKKTTTRTYTTSGERKIQFSFSLLQADMDMLIEYCRQHRISRSRAVRDFVLKGLRKSRQDKT